LLQAEFGATLTEATLGLTLFSTCALWSVLTWAVLGYSTATIFLTPITMRPEIGRRVRRRPLIRG